MVDWAGLEIRSLSQDRGFESLSLLEKEKVPYWEPFLFYLEERIKNPRRGFDKNRKSVANSAVFEITTEGRNP